MRNSVSKLVGLLPLAGIALIWFSAAERFHASASQSPISHQSSADFIPAAATFTGEAGCAACHHLDPILSHPVNIAPSMNVPSILPLEDGKVTCTTCHLDDSSAHSQARSAHGGMLRIAAPTALCAQCHAHATSDSPLAGRTMHAMLGRAHLQFPQRDNSLLSIASGNLDAESTTCLTCHDGSVARGVGIGIDEQPGSIGDHARSHTIGTIYKDHRSAAFGQTPFPMYPASTLNPRLRLFDGKLGCGSCHSPYAREDKLLVMSNTRSKLCLSCHQEN